MENRVGTYVPSENEVRGWIQTIEHLVAKLERYTCELSVDERRRTLRSRRGGERISFLVADLAERKKQDFGQGVSPGDLRRDLELAARIEPLRTAVAALGRRLEDTVFEAQAEAWWATTAYYTVLSRIASVDPALESALAPAAAFFATPRRDRSAAGREAADPRPVAPPGDAPAP